MRLKVAEFWLFAAVRNRPVAEYIRRQPLNSCVNGCQMMAKFAIGMSDQAWHMSVKTRDWSTEFLHLLVCPLMNILLL
jgi:hypothetical protein